MFMVTDGESYDSFEVWLARWMYLSRIISSIVGVVSMRSPAYLISESCRSKGFLSCPSEPANCEAIFK